MAFFQWTYMGGLHPSHEQSRFCVAFPERAQTADGLRHLVGQLFQGAFCVEGEFRNEAGGIYVCIHPCAQGLMQLWQVFSLDGESGSGGMAPESVEKVASTLQRLNGVDPGNGPHTSAGQCVWIVGYGYDGCWAVCL